MGSQDVGLCHPTPGAPPGQPGPACPPRLTEWAFLPGWASRTPCSLKRKKGDHPPWGSPHTSSNSVPFMAQVIHKHCRSLSPGGRFQSGSTESLQRTVTTKLWELRNGPVLGRSPSNPAGPALGAVTVTPRRGQGLWGHRGQLLHQLLECPPTARPARGHLYGPVSDPSETGRPEHSPPEQEQL